MITVKAMGSLFHRLVSCSSSVIQSGIVRDVNLGV